MTPENFSQLEFFPLTILRLNHPVYWKPIKIYYVFKESQTEKFFIGC